MKYDYPGLPHCTQCEKPLGDDETVNDHHAKHHSGLETVVFRDSNTGVTTPVCTLETALRVVSHQGHDITPVIDLLGTFLKDWWLTSYAKKHATCRTLVTVRPGTRLQDFAWQLLPDVPRIHWYRLTLELNDQGEPLFEVDSYGPDHGPDRWSNIRCTKCDHFPPCQCPGNPWGEGTGISRETFGARVDAPRVGE